MFIVILFIFLGIVIGYLLRKKVAACDRTKLEGVARWQGRIVTWLIWLLLFLLGIEVGSNERIISALPTLGVEALVLSVAATLGSCLLAWGLWRMVRKAGSNVASSKEINSRGGSER